MYAINIHTFSYIFYLSARNIMKSGMNVVIKFLFINITEWQRGGCETIFFIKKKEE